MIRASFRRKLGLQLPCSFWVAVLFHELLPPTMELESTPEDFMGSRDAHLPVPTVQQQRYFPLNNQNQSAQPTQNHSPPQTCFSPLFNQGMWTLKWPDVRLSFQISGTSVVCPGGTILPSILRPLN